jgi:antitoxin component of MazEF toxin-antitoxin module
MLHKKIRKVGNSPAIFLPRSMWKLLNVEMGDEVEIELKGRCLVIWLPEKEEEEARGIEEEGAPEPYE